MKRCSICLFSFLAVQALPLAADSYLQTNLVSDLSGRAANTDANLKNPWGMSFSPTSPIWVSDQGTNVSTLYMGTGTPAPLVVTTPPTTGIATGPTGQVFAGGSGINDPANGTAAFFIFSTLAGTVDSWNLTDHTTATVAATTPGAVYTGLALAGNHLYAANFNGTGSIDVFNSTFSKVSLSGSFTDPGLPTGYEPYNIQAIGGKLYIEYAQFNATTHMPMTGLGLGIVDVFNPDGTFAGRLITGGPLDAPWGVALAPSGFGMFSHDLLIGNFGNGWINAFDPTTGKFLGSLTDLSGAPIAISGLWAIEPGNSMAPNSLLFNAGINGQKDGLFGKIDFVPEPGSLLLAFIGALALIVVIQGRKRLS